MAVITEETLKKQLTAPNMFNDRVRTTNFNELRTQELIELLFNLKPSKAAELLESIDTLTDLKVFLLSFHQIWNSNSKQTLNYQNACCNLM